ncbi:MAG: DNA polymerase III subunit alpha [Proteobacteria bacterium]|nr:DNA polymerase III subunit alpha [Pseudomonadota bacterium]
MVHLHVRSWFSFLAGASSPEDLVRAAAAHGQRAVAITDLHGVYGAVRFARAASAQGLKPIFGATLLIAHPSGEASSAPSPSAQEASTAHHHACPPEGCGVRAPLVLLACSPQGYAHLCTLASAAHANDRHAPHLHLSQLATHDTEDIICLTGGREGWLSALIGSGRRSEAEQWLRRLARHFPGRLYVELTHHLRPGDSALVTRLTALAAAHRLPVVITNAVRYATPDHFPRHDALTCVRLGITVGDRHLERPVNDEACIKDERALRRLIDIAEAFTNTERIAERCTMNLLPGEITPPGALLPPGTSPAAHLQALCDSGVHRRYSASAQAAARAQLAHEMAVVRDLDLCEFFLVVHEVVAFARAQGIRHAGRGSAANSIIAYCLGITNVDPLRHHLLFERFLHRGRKGMPDIDVDFDSERRGEVITWMENRFGAEHAAMTAAVITYRARSAMREMMKVLGYDLDTISRVTRRFNNHDSLTTLDERRVEIAAITPPSPLLDTLFTLVAGLRHCPRHIGLHNGGMVLSRTPLSHHSPVQRSASGVRQLQFDKDDVESLGLIKFDVLGLRSLSVVSEALNLHCLDGGAPIDIDGLPLDDASTFELIRSGKTMSVFQIESPGQWNLLARVQPQHFDDLVAEVALFRPGPLQGGMVNPYVERRAGRQPVTCLHPSLEPILRDTFGIILYQEQVLEVSHQFAGMSLDEADTFRSLMSKWRDPGDMQAMRERFVGGAMRHHGVDEALASTVFDQVAAFVGYGFCRSHAAAFAQIVYQTAWLKAHHGAAFMGAVLQHHPGFYPLSTVLEEVKHMGIAILPVDVWRSHARYRVERGAIRLPLTQVSGLSEPLAERIVQARDRCRTLEALRRAVELTPETWDSLARAGAFDAAGPSGARDDEGSGRRHSLWHLGLLRSVETREGNRSSAHVEQLELFERAESDALFPALDALGEAGAVRWDLETLQMSGGRHPVALHRGTLRRRGVVPIEAIPGMAARASRGRRPATARVAGVVVTFQRPPTAKGMTFIVLEDETGRLPVAVAPSRFETLRLTLRSAALVVEGAVQTAGTTYHSLLVREAHAFDDYVNPQERGPKGGRT